MEYMIIGIEKMDNKMIYSREHKLLSERLRQARIDADLDQIQVARLLKKTQSYVSKIESGQRKIDIVQLKEFVRIYDKNINYFLDK